MKRIAVVDGHVDQKDLHFEDHKRGKNWIARAEFDPDAGGNLAREFFDGHGRYKKVPEDLAPGDVIEVGYDYYTTSGNQKARRVYYEIAAVDETGVGIFEVDKPSAQKKNDEARRLGMELRVAKALSDEAIYEVGKNRGFFD
jgi:hypothetical protein